MGKRKSKNNQKGGSKSQPPKLKVKPHGTKAKGKPGKFKGELKKVSEDFYIKRS